MKILLITPPFTQLNTPYPATAYLKPVLQEAGHEARQLDLGILTFLAIFSSKGLKKLYDFITANVKSDGNDPIDRFLALEEQYMSTIDPVISFLQGENDSLAHRINSGCWLPEGDRQEYDQEVGLQFSDDSVIDKARHKATLYLEEIGDIITIYCDPLFGFSRYGERIALSPPEFAPIEEKIKGRQTFVTSFMLNILKVEISSFQPELCGFTIPFPGNLMGGLICAAYIKRKFQNIHTVAGGGYINTELREIKDPAFFGYFDFMTLDDGEKPLLILADYINEKCSREKLKRTFLLNKDRDSVVFIDCGETRDIPHKELPPPDFRELMRNRYISLLPVTNKMHRLWSEGKWNKMTLAHGCYWHRCAFCDTSMDYIKRYEPASAKVLVDRIEKIIEDTGNHSFHFVDEAAPPAILKNLAIELIKRNIVITWWTNIRFEKSFKPALCRLLGKSGCIAVSGGLEVASDRLLACIDKGVTVKQVSSVTGAFHQAGIMVHTYLMYGFPGQTENEIIDALETVRQLFCENLIDSAFWHQFALTAHSLVGLNPDSFGVKITGPTKGSFAYNDLLFETDMKYDPSIYSSGLKMALANYMIGQNLDKSVNKWFPFKTPKTTIKKSYISNILKNRQQTLSINDTSHFIWIGANLTYNGGFLHLHDVDGAEKIKASLSEWNFLSELLKMCNIRGNKKITTVTVENISKRYSVDLDEWLSTELFSVLSTYGLLVI